MTRAEENDDEADRLRIDRWLWCARFFKSRSAAAEAVRGGHVRLNGQRVKPAHAVKIGDALQRMTGVRPFKLQAGAATSLYWAIDTVRKGGIVSVVGVYGPTFNLVPIGNVLNKGITVRANQACVKRYLPRCFEHIEAGHIRPKDVISHRIPLEDIAEGYHMFAKKLDGMIKPMVIPPLAA